MLTDRLRGALWGIFIGDALAMPAHWSVHAAHAPGSGSLTRTA